METRGVRVRFSSPAHENRYWWAIIECDGRFLVCARERLVLPDGLVEYTVADRWNGIRGHVPDGRSGVTGACRPADAAWLLEQAKAQGITDAKPLHVAEYRQERDRSSENDSINDDSWPYTGPSPSFDSSSSFGGGTSTGSGATGSW